MDEFGFPSLEVEQATMAAANITDPIDLPWNNTDNLFTRLITLKSIRRREERIIKRLKGKGMFGEIPFMLRLQTSRHLLDRGMARFMQSSVPYFFHPVDYAERPRSILPNEVADFLDVPIQRTNPQLMGGFIPARSLAVTDLHNLEEVFDYGRPAVETPMPDREGAASATTECQRYGMANGCDEYCPVLLAGLCEFQDSDNAALYAAATSNSV